MDLTHNSVPSKLGTKVPALSSNKVLEGIGLTRNESEVYLMLLEHGSSLAGEIAKKTGIHRRNVYDVTLRLIKKGLIGYIVNNNRKHFEAVNPKRLGEILDEKQRDLGEGLADLEAMFMKVTNKQETLFYSGKEGLKNIFESQLGEKGEVLILGASRKAFEVLPFYFKWYDEGRVKKKVKVRIIANEKLGKVSLSEVRYISSKYANPLAINIWGENVALIIWKVNPIAILIKDKDVAESYKKYFEAMWVSARKG
ncbi:MAG: hypothetical protein KJ592_03715 [Nanoarchaeota archaeon]|nr:hypothetical protein [Nanoarchaeota archaeon]